MRNLCNLLDLDIGLDRELASALDGHHDLFQSGIAGALADTVDGNLRLPRTRHDTSKRVGGGHAKVVVAVSRYYRLVDIRNIIYKKGDLFAEFFRETIAGGVGNIDHGGAGGNHSLHNLGQIFIIGTADILCIKLNIIHFITGILYSRNRTLYDFLTIRVEFIFDMIVGSADTGVNSFKFSEVQGIRRSIDILFNSTRKGADATFGNDLGYLNYRFEIAGA